MENWIKRNTRNVEYELLKIYSTIGIDTPENHDKILRFVCEDIFETADLDSWHSGDVSIAFRRFLES